MPEKSRWPKLAENGLPARLLLAWLSAAGLLSISLAPALADSLVARLGYTAQLANMITSANLYGTALGAAVAIFATAHMRWKTAVTIALIALVLVDLCSLVITDALLLAAVRLFHGCIGGALAGFGFSVIARTDTPVKAFGIVLLLHLGLGGVVFQVEPLLAPKLDMLGLYGLMISCGVLALLALPFLSDYSRDRKRTEQRRSRTTIAWRSFMLAITALFVSQLALMGLYSNILDLAASHELPAALASTCVFIGALCALAGAAWASWVGHRFGYVKPLFYGMIVLAMSTTGFIYGFVWQLFLLANVLIGITWALTLAFLFGLVAMFDEHGRMAAIGNFIYLLGLVAGQVIFSRLAGGDTYTTVIAITIVLFYASAFAIWYPAQLQDRKGVQAKTVILPPVDGSLWGKKRPMPPVAGTRKK